VLSFDIGIVASWGSLVVACHCAMLSLSLSWLRRSSVVVGPCCCSCGRWALVIVCVATLSVHRRHLLFGCHITLSDMAPGHWGARWLFIMVSMVATVDVHLFATLLTAMWHLDSKQWGGKVVIYSLGWPKTTRW